MESIIRIQEMLEKKVKIVQDGSPQRVQKQRAVGKLTARKCLDLLFDPGTFQEHNIFMKYRCHNFRMKKAGTPAEGVVTGYGLVNGRGVFAFAHDFTVLGSAMGKIQGMKVKRIRELALGVGAPFVGLSNSGGGRIQEDPAISYGAIFHSNVMASGVIPQIPIATGSCTGGTVYSPALTDFIFSVDRTSRSFLTGSSVVKNVTGETVDEETLGGARTHNTFSSVPHYFCEDDAGCIEQIKILLSYLPPNYREPPPVYPCTDAPDRHCEILNTFISDNERKTYNVKDIILEIAGNYDFFERQAMYATNVVTSSARTSGEPVGVVTSQLQSLAGCIDINASDKAARFIRAYDCFNILLLSTVSAPGFLLGIDRELGGTICYGAKILCVWSKATVPETVMAVGKVVSGACPAMCSWELHLDIIFAWPSAQMIVVGAESAVDIYRKKELKAAREAEEDVNALRRQYIEEYTQELVNPYKAAEFGRFEDIVEPVQFRHIIIRALGVLRNEKVVLPARKHGNIPL